MDQKQRNLFMKATQIALEFGFIVAVPLVVFGFIGKYLDSRMHTKYWVLIGILLALGSTILWIYKRIKEIRNELKNL